MNRIVGRHRYRGQGERFCAGAPDERAYVAGSTRTRCRLFLMMYNTGQRRSSVITSRQTRFWRTRIFVHCNEICQRLRRSSRRRRSGCARAIGGGSPDRQLPYCFPGVGLLVGASCFPKRRRALLKSSSDQKLRFPKSCGACRAVNEAQKERLVVTKMAVALHSRSEGADDRGVGLAFKGRGATNMGGEAPPRRLTIHRAHCWPRGDQRCAPTTIAEAAPTARQIFRGRASCLCGQDLRWR